IARRVLDEAERGVPFDEMAIILRAPQLYVGLIEHACARAGVPAYFDRGTRRPDPAGRAFVALLQCAVDGLSAKRFDEYLSLGQVPAVDSRQSSVDRQSTVDSRPTDDRRPSTVDFIAPSDEVFAAVRGFEPLVAASQPEPGIDDPLHPAEPDSDEEAVVAGTLRSPWKWEELIVESAVVGGRTRADGHAR